jgi:Protein of unknown function (DUF2637)
MNERLAPADRWIRATTTASVVLLAGIAAVVSYRHMHTLTLAHGESRWTAALIPLSVDGMIIASSMTLLADSRTGQPGGVLPWALLTAGSVASLTANVAVAQPTVYGRMIAAWPSFALIGAYELLMRQIRHAATTVVSGVAVPVIGRQASGESAGDSTVSRPAAEAVRRSSAGLGTGRRPTPSLGARRGSRSLDADLLARARRIDDEHRATHDRPASAETLRIRLQIGAVPARALKDLLLGVPPASTPRLPRTSTG